MAIAVDARSAGAQGGGATVSWNHTVAGADRILLVGASITGNNTATIAPPVRGAQTFLQFATVNVSVVGSGQSGPLRVYLFYLIAPATGTDSIVVTPTYGIAGWTQASSISLTGVHQSSPFNAAGPHTQNTTNAQPSIVVTSAADEWALAVWSAISNPDPTMAVGAGQTGIGDLWTGDPNYMQHLFTDEDAAGASVTMNYTGLNVDPTWGVGGIGASLMPAGGPAPDAFVTIELYPA